jgi:hypothetical protein
MNLDAALLRLATIAYGGDPLYPEQIAELLSADFASVLSGNLSFQFPRGWDLPLAQSGLRLATPQELCPDEHEDNHHL